MKSIDLMSVGSEYSHVHEISLIVVVLLCLRILVVLEVEQRKTFLDQMTRLGKRKEYQQVISNEIADVSSV